MANVETKTAIAAPTHLLARGDGTDVPGYITPAQGSALLSALLTISGNTTLTKATHQGATLFCTAAVSLTVDNSTDFDAGQGVNIIAEGGVVTVVATATVNRVAGKPLTIPRYDAASLLRTNTTDVYLLFGGMA